MEKYLKGYLIPALIYYLILFFSFFLLVDSLHISNQNFLNWDAFHYDLIRKDGYDVTRSAFFPLFPYIWRWSGLSPIGISILNGLIFIVSISYLLYEYRTDIFTTLIIYSIPSGIFYFFPYTESFFFISSMLLLISVKKGNTLLMCITLFMLSLIRPTISVLLPAIVIVLFSSQRDRKSRVRNLSLITMATLTGLLLTFGLHYLGTGQWDAFFFSQKKWGNELQLPSFPLRSWAGDMISRLDGVALLVSVLAGIFLLNYYYRILVRKSQENNNALHLSMLYLAGTGLLVLFYRDGVLFSLNRFIFCTPFFIVAFIYLIERYSGTSTKSILIIFLLISVYWLCFGSFVHIRTLMRYEILTVFLLLTLLLKNQFRSVRYGSFGILMIINSGLFLCFYYRIITNSWVG